MIEGQRITQEKFSPFDWYFISRGILETFVVLSISSDLSSFVLDRETVKQGKELEWPGRVHYIARSLVLMICDLISLAFATESKATA